MTDYSQIDAVNSSTLKVLYFKSPLHYFYNLTAPHEESPAMRLGTATHMAILEPDRFDSTYTVRPDGIDGRTKDGKAWLAAHANDPILTANEYETIMGMRQAVERHDAASELIRSIVEVESVALWTDEETGIACKGRLDAILRDGSILDLKTTKSTDPRQFAADAAKYGYDFSMSFYHDARIAMGHEVPRVILLAVESAAPHDCVPFVVTEDDLDVGREKYRTALTRLAKCRASGKWPGRFDGATELVLPQWAYPEEKPETLKGWAGLERDDMEASDE